MIVFIVLIFLSGIIQSECNEKENCISEKLRQCSEEHKTIPKFYPSSLDDLKQYCRTIEQKDECIRNSWTDCVTVGKEMEVITSRLNDSLSDHNRHICNFTTTYSKLFVKYGKCLNLTVYEQNKCQDKYKIISLTKNELSTAVGLSSNNSRAETIHKIRQICCWWTEYQSCAVRSVVDRCGEHAAILVNEEFFKTYTTSATSRILTYKSCLPQDKSFRFPVCFLPKSDDPKSFSVPIGDKEMTVEDSSRLKDIEETIGLTSNLTDFAQIEASIDNHNNSVSNVARISQMLLFILILLNFN